MASAVHYKGRTRSDLAKLPNNQFIAYKVEMILNILLEIRDILKVIVVGVFTNLSIGALNHIL